MATLEEKIAGRVEFGKARLDAFGELDEQSILSLQRKVAGDEILLKSTIQDPKTPEGLKEKLVYYYKEVATHYYDSKSNDVKRLSTIVTRQVAELEEDITADNTLIQSLHKSPLLNIIRKTKENIRAKQSFSNRIAGKAKKILELPVGGALAAAATKSPLIGLAVAAYEFSNKQKKKEKAQSLFHIEQALDEKVLERTELNQRTADSIKPAKAERVRRAPKASETSEASNLPSSFDTDDKGNLLDMKGLAKYINDNASGHTPTYTLRAGEEQRQSQGRGLGDVRPITDILKKHTNLLAGTYRNSKAIVTILEADRLNKEENDGEKPRSLATLVKGTGQAALTKGGDFLSKIQSFAVKIGPAVLGAVSGIMPMIAAAMPGLAIAAVAAISVGIGTAIREKTGLGKWLDKQLGVDENEANSRQAAADIQNIGIVSRFRKEHNGMDPASYYKMHPEERGKVPTNQSVESSSPSAPSAPMATPVLPSAAVPSAPSASPVAPEASKTDSIPSLQSISADIPINYGSYITQIGKRESGNNYKAENTLGYLGKYQLGAPALEDLGLLKKGASKKGKIKQVLADPNNWTIKGGKEAFLNNPELQERAMKSYTKRNFQTLTKIGAISKSSSKEQIAGYLAASHLLGPGAVKNLNSTDAYGTKGTEYYALGQKTQSQPSLAASGSGSIASVASDSGQSGRREMTNAINQSPAQSSAVPAILFNSDNRSTSMVGGGSRGPVGIMAPTDNTPTIRSLIGT